MTENWKNSQTTDLFKAVLKLRTAGECEKFFRDLCTLKEIEAMSERWQVVKMVDKEVSYRDVSEKTGASTATITRVAHWLHHGEGGYRMVLNRL